MRKYVARLVECGVSRELATAICREYERRQDYLGLIQYVEKQEQDYLLEKEEQDK